MADLTKVSLFVLFFTLTFTVSHVRTVYVDYGYPYDVGEFTDQLDTTLWEPTVPGEGPRMQTRAFYPTVPGEYAVFYFVTGFFGLGYPVAYSDVLRNIASHGYVAIGGFGGETDDGEAAITGQDHIDNIAWLKENAAEDLGGVIPNFNFTAMGCHSAGCAIPPDMYLIDSHVAQAQVNIEPQTLTIINQNMSFSVPALNLGAELCNLTCCFPGSDFMTHHEKWSCPKLLMEAAGVGHCDMLDDAVIESCTVACGGSDADLNAYRMFLQGMAAAFATGFVQGNPDQLKYVTDSNEVVWPLLQHSYTEEC